MRKVFSEKIIPIVAIFIIGLLFTISACGRRNQAQTSVLAFSDLVEKTDSADVKSRFFSDDSPSTEAVSSSVAIAKLSLPANDAAQGIQNSSLQEVLIENHSVGGTDLYAPPSGEGVISYQQEEENNVPDLYYTVVQVQPKEYIGLLSQRFDVSEDSIISVNNIGNTRTVQIGEYLKIPSIDGIAYTVNENDSLSSIAKNFGLDMVAIEKTNGLTAGEILHEGTRLFLPGAKLDPFLKAEINGDLFQKPISGHYYYSSYFGWRQNPFNKKLRGWHGGVDMATKKGTRIKAAMAGTVISNGWSDVYGWYVRMKHHSGYVTLYGHMREQSSMTVGKWYEAGKTVGYVGSTGQSTGPHLHFGVYKYGQPKNPLFLMK